MELVRIFCSFEAIVTVDQATIDHVFRVDDSLKSLIAIARYEAIAFRDIRFPVPDDHYVEDKAELREVGVELTLSGLYSQAANKQFESLTKVLSSHYIFYLNYIEISWNIYFFP